MDLEETLTLRLDPLRHAGLKRRARWACRTVVEQAEWELSLPLETRLEPRARLGVMVRAHATSLAALAEWLLDPAEELPRTAPPLPPDLPDLAADDEDNDEDNDED